MARLHDPIDYRLELQESSASTGYFTAVPEQPLDLEASLAGVGIAARFFHRQARSGPDADRATLLANGLAPIYVDISGDDTGLPVVKALMPGFETMADADAFSRISGRLFNN